MGQTFAEQNSASQQSAQNSSFGNSSSKGSSFSKSGSSSNEWSNSQSGLATGLRQMIDLGEDALNAINSSEALQKTMDLFNTSKKQIENDAKNYAKKQEEGWKDFWENGFMQSFANSWDPFDEHWNGHY